MGQSYESQMRKMELEGYKRHRVPQHCRKCNTDNTIMRKDGTACFHCNEMHLKTVKRVLTGILALVLMCCVGCQSAPSKVTVQACVAGQTLNVQVMR